jgi:prophage DNA circulation protein
LLGSLFPTTITTLARPDSVIGAVTDTLAGAAAAVDVLRQTYPTDPATSAKLRDQVAAYVATTVPVIDDSAAAASASASAASTLVGIIRQFGAALPAEAAVRATLELAAAYPAPATASPAYQARTVREAADNAAATARLVRLGALTAYAEATLRRTFADRPAGITARGEIAERFENELYDTTGAAQAALYVAIEQLRGKVIEWLTKAINDLAPVITVESARIRPSLDLAWILYADPTRADELVARNKVRNPAFMPRQIEALAR